MNGKIIEAAKDFEKVNDYIRALECYDTLKNYEGCLEVIYKMKDYIPDKDRESYVKKYLPLALSEIIVKLDL